MRLYLDTSVISVHDDPRDPELQRLTREFWPLLASYEVFVSEVVYEEILAAPRPRVEEMLALLDGLTSLSLSPEAEQLAQAYLEAGVFTSRQYDDACHVAVATVFEMDLLASWNFRHLVRRSVRQQVHLVNLQMGYNRPVEIVAPRDLL